MLVGTRANYDFTVTADDLIFDLLGSLWLVPFASDTPSRPKSGMQLYFTR